MKIPAAGKYTIDVESTSSAGSFDIAVGKGVVGKLLVFIFGGIAVGFVGTVLGVITLIVTGVKRGRRKREAQAALAPAGAPGPWGVAPAPTAWDFPSVGPPTAPTPAPPAPPWTTPPGPPPPSPTPGGGMPPPPPPPPPPT